jgi:phosphoglycolate phosphatase
MVGDRRHDVEGAGAHGIDTIGVLWGYGSEGELRAAGAVDVVASPRELAAHLLAGDSSGALG